MGTGTFTFTCLGKSNAGLERMTPSEEVPMRLTLVAVAVSTLAIAGCASRPVVTAPQTAVAAPSAPTVREVALKEGQVVAAPGVSENLTVSPLTSNRQKDIGALLTLEDALAKGTAIVRELEADRTPPLRQRAPAVEQEESFDTEQTEATGPQVNALVIENKGS